MMIDEGASRSSDHDDADRPTAEVFEERRVQCVAGMAGVPGRSGVIQRVDRSRDR